MDKIAQGDLGDETAQDKGEKGDGEEEPAQPVDIGVEPPPPDFIMDLPNISSIDLCVVMSLCRSRNHY